MASTINAQSTGVGGINASGDASGVLALQTGGTTAVTIDASQHTTFSGFTTCNTYVDIGYGGAYVNGNLLQVSGAAIDVQAITTGGGLYYSGGWKYSRSYASPSMYIVPLSSTIMSFQIAPANAGGAGAAAIPIPSLALDTGGNILQIAPAGLGYGTGSGGTVTQATSKSTAVTLNKPTGQITMNNAALAAGNGALFTFNNSLLASTDVLLLSLTSNVGAYRLSSEVHNGSAYIYVVNFYSTSLSDALIINFAIIKGATS